MPSAASARRLSLAPGEVHVFFTELDTVTAPSLLQAYQDVLDAEERARAARFHFEHDRRQFLVAHALLRAALRTLSKA